MYNQAKIPCCMLPGAEKVSWRKVEKSNPIYNSALKGFSDKHPFAKEWINMGTPDWHLKQMNISQ